MPFQSSWLLPLVVLFVQSVVDFVAKYQWFANGLTLAGRMLPGLGFAILLRYLPVKRHLHYLALGFGLTAMLTVLYSNVQSVGAAISSMLGTDAFAKLPKEQMLLLLLTTSKCIYDWYCHYRYLPCSATL